MKRIVCLMFAAVMCAAALAQEAREVQHFAHRGSRYEFDENTLSAFQGTYDKGIRGNETDVRITKDGELVINHDKSLKRTAGVDMIIEESTRKELKKVKSLQGNPVLFVDELCKWLSKRDSIYVEFEMKSSDYSEEQLEVYCDKLYKMAMAKKPANSTYLFTSFDARALRVMKALHPEADIMYIVGEPVSDKHIKKALELDSKRLACNMNGTSRAMVQKAHKAGLIVSLWPGGGIEDFQLGVALGADALCCDKAVEVMEFAKKNMPWVKLSKHR